VTAPEFYLEHLSESLWDPVDPTSVGSLDPKLHARVNGEIYRFARPTTLARFRRHPLLYCGVLRDPVNGRRFSPNVRSPRFEATDGPYFFTCESTFVAFSADTAKYSIHRLD
jgi:YHS domain-containing protein